MRLIVGFALLTTLAAACSSSSSTTSSTSSSSSGTGGHNAGTGVGGSGGGSTNMCSAAIAMVLKPVDKVSTGSVTILNTSGATTTLLVDATAGGFGNSDTYPRVYINLQTLMRVDITDKQAPTSTAWDLALKRPVLFTNDGDGGPGMGGTRTVAKPFDQVTAADATGMFATESFVDAQCNPKTDPVGEVLTTLSSWYDYNQATNQLTPKPNTTFIIRGATGKLYKVAITTYYGQPNGGMAGPSGNYILQVGAL